MSKNSVKIIGHSLCYTQWSLQQLLLQVAALEHDAVRPDSLKISVDTKGLPQLVVRFDVASGETINLDQPKLMEFLNKYFAKNTEPQDAPYSVEILAEMGGAVLFKNGSKENYLRLATAITGESYNSISDDYSFA